MASTHQIAAQILAGPHQVTQALGLDGRDADAMQLAGHQQPHETLGITLIGLHPIRRTARNQARRAHQAIHPGSLQPARQREPVGPAS